MITKQTIADSIKRYETNRGWGRFFFGNTKGITQLKKIYKELPDVNLSDVDLRRLYINLCNRRDRLRNRQDNYSTKLGEEKLTNQIYRGLEDLVISDYEQIMLEKAPNLRATIPSKDTPFEDLVLFETIDDDTKQISDWNAVDLGAYLLAVSSWDGLKNPYTEGPLPNITLKKIRKHTSWGPTVLAIESFTAYMLLNIANPSVSAFAQSSICDLSQQDGEIINLRTWITHCTYDEYSANHAKIMTAFNDIGIKRNPDLIEKLNHVIKAFETLRDSDNPNASGEEPLIVFYSNTLMANKAGRT